MRYPTADELVVIGLWVLLAYLVVNDVNRSGFRPAWQVYLGLLVAILAVMGYSVDTTALSITPPDRPPERDDPRSDEVDK